MRAAINAATIEIPRHRILILIVARFSPRLSCYTVRHLRSAGVEVPDELLAHVAPLGWEHVGLTGDYLWSELDRPRERFRPLRIAAANRKA